MFTVSYHICLTAFELHDRKKKCALFLDFVNEESLLIAALTKINKTIAFELVPDLYKWMKSMNTRMY